MLRLKLYLRTFSSFALVFGVAWGLTILCEKGYEAEVCGFFILVALAVMIYGIEQDIREAKDDREV